MERNCPYCQNALPDRASFCMSCFSRLIDLETVTEKHASAHARQRLGAAAAAVLLSAESAAILCLFSSADRFAETYPAIAGGGIADNGYSSSYAGSPSSASHETGSSGGASGQMTSSGRQDSSARLDIVSSQVTPYDGVTSSVGSWPAVSSRTSTAQSAASGPSYVSSGKPSSPSAVSSKTQTSSSTSSRRPTSSSASSANNADGTVDFSRYPYAAASDFSWEPYDGGVSITEYKGDGGVVRIPSQLGGQPVVMIAASAFRGSDAITHLQTSAKHIDAEAFQECKNLVQADLPGVEYIHLYAFRTAVSLTKVTLYDGLLSIGTMAFADCISLEQLELPSTVKIIEWGSIANTGVRSLTLPASVTSFDNNSSVDWVDDTLEEVIVEPGNSTYYSVDGVVFMYRGSDGRGDDLLHYYPGWRRDTSYTVFTDVAPYAFASARYLEELTFTGGRALNIGERAFQFCSSLTNVRFYASVSRIGMHTFLGCGILSSITLPPSAGEINDYMFYECNNLTKIYIPATLDLSSLDDFITAGIVYPKTTLYVKRGSSGEEHAKHFSLPYAYY